MNADKRGFLGEVVAELIGLKYREVTDVTLGTFYDVYNELGFGFLESVYREAMAIALVEKGFRVEKEIPMPVYFRGRKVSDFRCDLLVNGCLLLELKAVKGIDPVFEAQTLNYLRATEIEVALLLNFGPKPTFRRLVFENSRKQIRENPRRSAAGVS
jgi:GxxExxY protein